MTQKLITDFYRSCRNITACAQNRAVNCAVGYARHGLMMTDPKEIQVQCLYILNSISRWHGPIATETRDTLKQLAKDDTWKEVV